MQDINHILVKGCRLCSIFLDKANQKDIEYTDGETIEKSDFIIIKDRASGLPLVTVRDHIDTIPNPLWGRILYQCRNLYDDKSRLRCDLKNVESHWYAYIVSY